jgi:hypothetical protein
MVQINSPQPLGSALPPPEYPGVLKLASASNSGRFQGLSLKTQAMGVAVLADKGVELSLSVEIIKQVPHQLGPSCIDGKLTPLVFGASPIDNYQHVRISLTGQTSQSR